MLTVPQLDTNNIPVNTPLIDSLKLRIPFDACIILDEKLTTIPITIIEDTGEVVKEHTSPVPYTVIIDNVTFRFQLTQIPIYDEETKERVPTRFIEIVLTSKLLRERYFECINKNNLKHFYDTFMSYKVFSCEYDTFINSQVSDIDICINRYTENFQQFADILNDLFIQSGIKQKYLRIIKDRNNIGLMFNQRQSAKPTLPYIKLYHKELELLSKSADFYNTYLFPKYTHSIRNLTRIEVTIKNTLHKRRLYKYGILSEFKTLKDLVLLSSDELYNLVKFSISSYIEKTIRKKSPNLSPTDHIIFELIQNCVLKGYDYKSLELISKTFQGTKVETTQVAQSRIKKKIKDIFDLLIHKDLKIETQVKYNAHICEYLRYLGLS